MKKDKGQGCEKIIFSNRTSCACAFSS